MESEHKHLKCKSEACTNFKLDNFGSIIVCSSQRVRVRFSWSCSLCIGMMSNPNNSHMPGAENLARVVAERRWQLGAISSLHPKIILGRICDYLANAERTGRNQVAWKKGGPYNLRCKWLLQAQSKCTLSLPFFFLANECIMHASHDVMILFVDKAYRQYCRSHSMTAHADFISSNSFVWLELLALEIDRASHSTSEVFAGAGDHASSDNYQQTYNFVKAQEVKFEIQLYKRREEEYCVDVQVRSQIVVCKHSYRPS